MREVYGMVKRKLQKPVLIDNNNAYINNLKIVQTSVLEK